MPFAAAPTVDLDASVLNGITIEAGKTFDVPAVVTGRPYPEITWSKGVGGELSDRVFIKKTGDGMYPNA